MFGLFKKKEAEKGPDTLSAPQHPAAAALSAQFAPDEFDILAVTGPSGFDGDRAGPRNFNAAQYETRVQGLVEAMQANQKAKEEQ